MYVISSIMYNHSQYSLHDSYCFQQCAHLFFITSQVRIHSVLLLISTTLLCIHECMIILINTPWNCLTSCHILSLIFYKILGWWTKLREGGMKSQSISYLCIKKTEQPLAALALAPHSRPDQKFLTDYSKLELCRTRVQPFMSLDLPQLQTQIQSVATSLVQLMESMV